MKQLKQGSDSAPVRAKAGPNLAEHRRLIDDAIGELLMLLSQKATHELLRQKVEALHQRIQEFAAIPKRPAAG